ncbi:MAG: hypothetical protein QN152_03290 [Armatimonadota bacterium]|nr:hypothetical protein [Armatimonadota bacterium]MDR7427074.1 hypothetical protein [Armatimonadota bacterium]MDR7468713.1 hypothetical protein [Armatimonadota bacterium]MDR7474842.1 hypothetical protein [Armatimonadota bacterium]MDR7538541.1 hypothetical protein [Armatimonadota bacterium]
MARGSGGGPGDHAVLLLRLGADLTAWEADRRWGALLNVLAVLVFVANTGVGVQTRRSST